VSRVLSFTLVRRVLQKRYKLQKRLDLSIELSFTFVRRVLKKRLRGVGLSLV